MAATSGEEVGSDVWEAHSLWQAGHIYLLIYEVLILMCSLF